VDKRNPRPPNWPIWPKKFVRQDLNGDFDAGDLKTIVGRAFYLWHILFIVMVWNLVAMTAALATESAIGDFILAIVYIILWLPICFLTYRRLYNAARKGSALGYWLFFFFKAWEVIALIFAGLGVRGSGMAGLIWMIHAFSENGHGHKITGIFCLIGCALWWLSALAGAYLWVRLRVYYRNAGGSRQVEKDVASAAGRTVANNPDAARAAASHL